MRELNKTRTFNGNLIVDHQVVDDPMLVKIEQGKALLKEHLDKGMDPNLDVVTDMKKTILELEMGTIRWNKEHDKRHLKAYLRGDMFFHHGKDVKGEKNWFDV